MKILVVDDSAYNRQILTELLVPLDFVTTLSTAVDGIDAFNQLANVEPDLILLDLEMPNMDGFTFLRLLRKYRSTPVIVVSGLGYDPAGQRAERLGANGFVLKPTRMVSKRLATVSDELVASIRAVADALPGSSGKRAEESSVQGRSSALGNIDAIVIGASTGGPEAVSDIVGMLPEELPFAVIVTLHIPAWITDSFTRRLAYRLGERSAVKVIRAEDSGVIEPGTVVVTPGGYHIGFERRGASVVTTLEKGHSSDGLAPSIDRMFTSAASVWGSSLVGVIMTGMGNDGQKGVVDIKRGGGYVIAESERSSAIFSMPSSAISTGRVDTVLSSGEIGEWIHGLRVTAS
ncbi:MAG: chemotaxis protein CheB [Proteobacteria bacterium]|nr:chemotaxis protein CheB [Pseudomonadota bacterium]